MPLDLSSVDSASISACRQAGVFAAMRCICSAAQRASTPMSRAKLRQSSLRSRWPGPCRAHCQRCPSRHGRSRPACHRSHTNLEIPPIVYSPPACNRTQGPSPAGKDQRACHVLGVAAPAGMAHTDGALFWALSGHLLGAYGVLVGTDGCWRDARSPGAEIELGGFELLNRAAACQPSASGKSGTPMARAVSFIRRS